VKACQLILPFGFKAQAMYLESDDLHVSFFVLNDDLSE